MAFSDFSNTRVILDCTEVRIQTPSKLQAQRYTISLYKHYNTFKAFVRVTRWLFHLCQICGGDVRCIEAVENSGLVDFLNAGDGVMVDKGFRLEGVLPPFKMENQFSANNVIATRKIAGARIPVERVVRRFIEFYFIFIAPLPINMLDIADSIFRTCAFL